MKLAELHEAEQAQPVLAWLDSQRGPNDIMGVTLRYVQPLVAQMDDVIAKAQEQADRGDGRAAERAKRLLQRKEEYVKAGQRYFTPDLGWWMDEDDFQAGREGFGGVTKGLLQKKYPNLRIVSSEKEAAERAEEAGLI